MNNTRKFILVDSDYILAKIASSDDLCIICHEYLSIINNKLLFLIKLGIKLDIKQISFNNLFIVDTLKNSKYPYPIFNKIQFDITSFRFIYENNMCIPLMYTDFINNLIDNIKSNINVITKDNQQIVINNTTNNITNNKVTLKKKESININEEMESIKQLVNDLEKIKNDELKKLETIEVEYKNNSDEFSKLANNLGDDKRELRMLKEKEEEAMNIFECDKSIYRKMKKQIEGGSLLESNIPDLFNKKYPILKFLDDEGLLDTNDDYSIYTELYNDMYKGTEENIKKSDKYVPHDIHYRGKNKYKSLDEILAETYSDDDDNNDDENLCITNEVDMSDKSNSLLDNPIFK